ncbi:MAG: hypothetical protein WDZ41_01005 [Candidatus Babeliales bacterium]
MLQFFMFFLLIIPSAILGMNQVLEKSTDTINILKNIKDSSLSDNDFTKGYSALSTQRMNFIEHIKSQSSQDNGEEEFIISLKNLGLEIEILSSKWLNYPKNSLTKNFYKEQSCIKKNTKNTCFSTLSLYILNQIKNLIESQESNALPIENQSKITFLLKYFYIVDQLSQEINFTLHSSVLEKHKEILEKIKTMIDLKKFKFKEIHRSQLTIDNLENSETLKELNICKNILAIEPTALLSRTYLKRKNSLIRK